MAKVAVRRSPVKQAVPVIPPPVPEAPPSGNRKAWLLGLIFLVVLGALVSEILFMTKKKVSQNIEFVHVKGLVAKGNSDGQCGGAAGMAFDGKGNWYQLEGSDPNWRLQKFGPEMQFLAAYRPRKTNEIIQAGTAVAGDAQGRVYVLQNRGAILALDQALHYTGTIESRVTDAIDLDTDSKGNLYVLDRAEQQVQVIDPKGAVLLKFGKPGTSKNALASPMRLRLDAQDNIYVMESVNQQFRVKVFDKQGAYKRDFMVDLTPTPYSAMGLDSSGHLFFNDSAGDKGVRVYSVKGDYLGAAKSSTDNQMFPNEGFLTSSRWTGEIVINYASAVGKYFYQPKP